MEVVCEWIEDEKGSDILMKGYKYKGFNVRHGLTKGKRREDSGSKSFLGRKLQRKRFCD